MLTEVDERVRVAMVSGEGRKVEESFDPRVGELDR